MPILPSLSLKEAMPAALQASETIGAAHAEGICKKYLKLLQFPLKKKNLFGKSLKLP